MERLATSPEDTLAPGLLLLLAGGAGLSAASLYYNQPILDAIAKELVVAPAAIGTIPTLTQLGYAAGILLFAPLGDRLDRRKVIVAKALLLAIALVGAGAARSLETLAVASLAIGLAATCAQDLVPAAAALAHPSRRGSAIGTVMTGLLLGILLSRLASGAIGERFGWRFVFFGAAGVVLLLAATCALRLPRFEPTTQERYFALLRSIVRLARTLAPLQRAALSQALLSVAFSAFWSTLALELAGSTFHLGSTAAGAFGLAGAAGAAIAPVAGTLADRRGPEAVLRGGALLVILSFVAMAVWQGSIAVLVAGTVAFDLGVQACLVSHQSVVYGLDPSARSRLNAVLVSSMFLGMATGAALASRALARYGWTGVTVLGAIAATLALAVRLASARRA